MFASFATFLLSNALYFFLFVHGECVALLKFAYQQKLSRLCRRYQRRRKRCPECHLSIKSADIIIMGVRSVVGSKTKLHADSSALGD